MKLKQEKMPPESPKTIDITGFFKKFCIATRTKKIGKLQQEVCRFSFVYLFPPDDMLYLLQKLCCGKGVKNLNLTNTPKIVTERLILRKFTADDLEALFFIYADKEVNTFLPWFPVKNLEETKALLEEKYLKAYLEPQGYRYAICLKHDNIPVGYVNVSMDDSYDLGYGLRKEFWHKGIVTEAGQAMIAQLKKDNIPYITATHDVNNTRSGNVMKRLGMNYQYSYEEQWQPKDFPVTFRLYQLNLDGNDGRVYKKYWDHSAVHFIEKFEKRGGRL